MSRLKIPSKYLISVCVLGAWMLCTTVTFAAPGDPDLSFGTNGLVSAMVGAGTNISSSGPALAIQPDGMIVAVTKDTLARFQKNGLVDVNFGNNGIVKFTAPSGNSSLGVVVQASGAIVAFINGSLIRWNKQGNLDTAFGTNGVVKGSNSIYNTANAMAMQSDGKLVVVGLGSTSGGVGIAGVRYTVDGQLDGTFGPGGNLCTNLNGNAYSVSIQDDGKIVVGGTLNYYANGQPHNAFFLGRYTTGGILDSSFAGNGFVTFDPGPGQSAAVAAISIQASGKIVVAGGNVPVHAFAGATNNFVVRYNSNGSVDSTFGSNGVIQIPAVAMDYLTSIKSGSDGKIVLWGASNGGNGATLQRFNENGLMDSNFGVNGVATPSFNSNQLSSCLIQADGRIVVSGANLSNGVITSVIARYEGDSLLGLRSDMNGDHQIAFVDASPDQTSADKPFRFWLNDDHDTGDQADGNDLNNGIADNADMVVSSIRDLEDFAPLNLSLPSSVASSLHQGAKIIFSATGTGSLHLVPVSQPGFAYLFDPNYARMLTSLPGLPGVPTVPMYMVSSAATVSVPLDQLFSSPQSGDRTLGFIFEGVWAGDLVLSGQIVDANGSVVAQTENFYLHLGKITEFYNHFTVGNFEAMNAPVATTATELNPNAPDSTNPNVPYILFVHGWRLHTWERAKFAETAYKRLYWAGYRGGFGMFSWPTEWVDIPDSYIDKISIFSSLTNRGNYDRSELQAWKSATGLRNLIDSRLETGLQPRVRIIAHSMGNVVASEALRLGLNNSSAKKINSYIASQAATVSSAYDATVPFTSISITLNTGLFPASDIYRRWPIRNNQNYFAGISGMTLSGIYNFANPNDYALTSTFSWPANQSFKPDIGYNYWPPYNKYVYENTDPNAPPNPISYDVMPDCYLAFAFAAPATSNALGAEPSAHGEIQGTVRLDSYPMHYTDAKTDHSAEFLSSIHFQHYYWENALGYAGLGTIPYNPETTTPSSFQNWGLMWFGFLGNSTTSQASFSGDGIPNLTKYAFGLNPLRSDGVPQTTISKTRGQVQIQFWRRANLTDVSYTIEQSSDLRTWLTMGASLSVISTSGQMEFVSGVVPSNGTTQQFYRVRVGLKQ